MCHLIKVIHFGCEEMHSEDVLVRCQSGLEYILNMPFKDVCKGMVEVEDWVMSPCHLCQKYSDLLKASNPAGNCAETVSQEEHGLPDIETLVLLTATHNEPVTLKISVC